MNKKGFTLVELLATLVIIALIMSLVMPSASRMSQDNKDKIYKEYEKMMVEYARISDFNNRDTIDLFELEELEKVKNECVGYVTINHAVVPPEYYPYILCGDKYESPAFDVTKTNSMCPGCKYMFFPNMTIYATWNTKGQTPTVLAPSNYYENYEDVISAKGTHIFLGVRLNGSNQIEKAYACGLYNRETLFCIEGHDGDSKYATNKNILQNEHLWNNSCSVESFGGDEEIHCAPPFDSIVGASAYSNGDVDAIYEDGDGGGCGVYNDGSMHCVDVG